MNYNSHQCQQLIVALDTPSVYQAQLLIKKLCPITTTFKVGLELFSVQSPNLLGSLKEAGAEQLLVDLKLHDTPNTVEYTAQALARGGSWGITVHTLGGYDMMSAATVGVSTNPETLVFGVTVLTSLEERDLRDLGFEDGIKEQATRLAMLASAAQCNGVIASPQEIEIIRDAVPDNFLIITPGIRPAWANQDDQKRTMTPAQAIRAGADYIVVGRPITQALNPLIAAESIVQDIRRAL